MQETLKIDEKENEIAMLRGEVASLRELIVSGNTIGTPEAEVVEDGQSTIEKIIDGLLEPYTPEQIEVAQAWVTREIGGRLKIKAGPNEDPEVICNVMVVTPEHREAGLTNLPDGFTVTNSVPVRVFAAFYMPIILDEKYQSNKEKLLALIDHSRKEGAKGRKGRALHPELEYLFEPDGKTLKEKPRRNTRRHTMN